jgi:hypothetical protein
VTLFDCLIDWRGRLGRKPTERFHLSAKEMDQMLDLRDPTTAERFINGVINQWGGIDTREGHERHVTARV